MKVRASVKPMCEKLQVTRVTMVESWLFVRTLKHKRTRLVLPDINKNINIRRCFARKAV